MMNVLHIDDNQAIRETFSDVLSMIGLDVESTDNGKDGLKKIINGNFDAVLLDLTMPELSGFEVLEELQKQGKTPNNIFALTAMTLTDEQKKSLKDNGVKKILHKPIEVDNLCKEIESLQEGIKNE